MVQIEFYDDARVIKGILLGKYQWPHDEVYSYEKKFLWKTKTKYAHRTLNTPLYIVFIPWKHQLKDLRASVPQRQEPYYTHYPVLYGK